MKQKTRRLFHIKELTIDELKSMYDTFSERHQLARHQDKKVEYAIEIFLHFIAQGQLSEYDREHQQLGVAEINYDAAEYCIGDCFADVRKFLFQEGIIHIVEGYVVGEKCLGYIIDKQFTIVEWYVPEGYCHTYFDKLTTFLNREEEKKENTPSKGEDEWNTYPLSNEEKRFRKTYNQNLNKIKIIDKNKFIDYINNLYFEDYNKELAYKYQRDICLEKEHKVYNWDRFGRIHHFLTNCPKSYRQFFNIDFVRDLHNSQPLLISSLLFEFYNIDLETRRFIATGISDTFCYLDYPETISFQYQHNTLIYHYDPRNDCKTLNNNVLQDIKSKIDSLPIDVLEYLYLVISGTLWDYLSDVFGMDRSELKGTMFGELFYSNAKGIMSWQKHAKAFQAHFPNVTKAIVGIRNSHDKNWFPHEMQRRESRIMRSVLSYLFYKGYDVVSIHDEIVVLDTSNNRSKYAVDDYGDNVQVIERDVELGIMYELYTQLGIEGSLGFD